MFKRARHQKILKVLQAFDAELLARTECFFAGGTAIAMSLGEYRESVDIDFLCASADGYRFLRNAVNNDDLGKLIEPDLPFKLTSVRDVRSDQNKIYTVLAVDDVKIKVKFVRETRVSLTGFAQSNLPVQMLSREDLYTEKLLANDDRGLDRAVMSRDVIDLAMMIQAWGRIARPAWDKAYAVYGDRLSRMFHLAVGMIDDRTYLSKCLHNLAMDDALAVSIRQTLHTAASTLPLNLTDQLEFDRRLANIEQLKQRNAVCRTLGNHLMQALKNAPNDNHVDWASVEMAAAGEAIFRQQQPVENVIEAINQHSPGTVSTYRQDVVSNRIKNNLFQLKLDWFEHSVEEHGSQQTVVSQPKI